MAALNRSAGDRVCMALAVALGLVIGWLDIHTTEVIVTITGLLSAGVLCGALRPRAPWRWAVPIALGLPLVEGIALAAHVGTAEPIRLDPRVWSVAAALGFTGCYVGALIGRLLRAMTHATSSP